jgi:hypothetical protein
VNHLPPFALMPFSLGRALSRGDVIKSLTRVANPRAARRCVVKDSSGRMVTLPLPDPLPPARVVTEGDQEGASVSRNVVQHLAFYDLSVELGFLAPPIEDVNVWVGHGDQTYREDPAVEGWFQQRDRDTERARVANPKYFKWLVDAAAAKKRLVEPTPRERFVESGMPEVAAMLPLPPLPDSWEDSEVGVVYDYDPERDFEAPVIIMMPDVPQVTSAPAPVSQETPIVQASGSVKSRGVGRPFKVENDVRFSGVVPQEDQPLSVIEILREVPVVVRRRNKPGQDQRRRKRASAAGAAVGLLASAAPTVDAVQVLEVGAGLAGSVAVASATAVYVLPADWLIPPLEPERRLCELGGLPQEPVFSVGVEGGVATFVKCGGGVHAVPPGTLKQVKMSLRLAFLWACVMLSYVFLVSIYLGRHRIYAALWCCIYQACGLWDRIEGFWKSCWRYLQPVRVVTGRIAGAIRFAVATPFRLSLRQYDILKPVCSAAHRIVESLVSTVAYGPTPPALVNVGSDDPATTAVRVALRISDVNKASLRDLEIDLAQCKKDLLHRHRSVTSEDATGLLLAAVDREVHERDVYARFAWRLLKWRIWRRRLLVLAIAVVLLGFGGSGLLFAFPAVPMLQPRTPITDTF